MRDPLYNILGTRSRATVIGRSLAATIRGPVLWLTLCGALLVTAIFAGTIMMVGEFRERALGNSERELENTVLLLTRHFDQQFEDSKTIAADLISQLQVSRIASLEAFRQRMSRAETHDILKYKGLTYLGDVSLFDAEGELVNWSRPLPAPALNISERAYFKTFKSDPQSKPILAEAVRSLIKGKLQTVIAHRLNGENGVFLGVMTRRIDPVHYEKFFASVAPGAGAAISMFHADGTLMARYPRVDQMIGQNFATAPLLQRVQAQKQQLDTALNNMAQGLVLFDATARVVLHNQRYIDMFGLSTDVVKPGVHFLDLLRHRTETGSFAGDPDEFCSTVFKNLAEGKVTDTITPSADGRWFQIVNQPLPQGGWVATLEDITERRRLEQERDRNQAFLREIIDPTPSKTTEKAVRDRRYVLVNRVAESHFGLPRDAILGKTAPDMFPKASAEIIAADDET